jgi:hypothetical protein
VGTTVCFVAARGQQAKKPPTGWNELATVTGWSIYGPQERWINPRVLEEAALRLAEAHGDLALAAFVEDSDVGYLAAATEDGVVARLLLGAEGAADYAEGAEALALIEGDSRSQPDAFEFWSELAGSRISKDQVRGLLENDWIYKEDAIEEVFGRLGIELPWDRL